MSGAGLFGSTSIPVLEQVVNFAQSRHAVLAGNIANLDTPGYRVHDLSEQKFQARMRDALSSRDQGMSVSFDTGANASSAIDDVTEDLQGMLFHDDSNGSVEGQVAAITKNQMQHNLALAIMNNQFRMLAAAISERA